MASDDERRNESLAWDRVGQILENTGTLGQRVWQRNLTLWNRVSRHLRDDDGYSADDMAADAARAMVTAMDNLNDAWSFLTRPPERERVAATIPTAFLFFDRRDDETAHHLLDPVLIRVPLGEGEVLPQKALIALDGSSEAGSAALRKSLVAYLDQPGVYRLETYGEPTDDLEPGVYNGFVYITEPARPLANLRIVVEGPPPEV